MRYNQLLCFLFLTFSAVCIGQNEKLVIEGAIVIANNDDPNPAPGTIRWTGIAFEGWTGSEWISLNFSVLDEQDGDSTNEIQDLTLSGNTLEITLNGSPTQIDLSPYLDNTDTQLTESEVDNFISNNGYLTSEVDGDATNELQEFAVSESGDTLYLSNGNFVIVPGISLSNALSDPDGNVYTTVVIGAQEWMIENLKTTKYNDGTPIPLVTDNAIWEGLSTPAYCWFNNDETTYKDDYGALYNWYAVDTGKLCPIGWHVPTSDEFIQLGSFLNSNPGNKLKDIGTNHWLSPNAGTNESGFTAFGAGLRNLFGVFQNIHERVFFYTSTEVSSTNAWYATLIYDNSDMFTSTIKKHSGNSVRCLKN